MVDWDVVVSVATLLQTLVVVAGVWFAVSQIRQSTQARELESLVAIFDRMRAPERGASIEHLLTLPPTLGDWTDEDLAVAASEHQDFEQLGFLVRHRFLREQLIMEMYSLLIIDAWRALEPFERSERDRMGAPGFGRSFERLASRATKYRLDRGLRVDGRVSRRALRPTTEAVEAAKEVI
jgi:hypothetical protein